MAANGLIIMLYNFPVLKSWTINQKYTEVKDVVDRIRKTKIKVHFEITVKAVNNLGPEHNGKNVFLEYKRGKLKGASSPFACEPHCPA